MEFFISFHEKKEDEREKKEEKEEEEEEDEEEDQSVIACERSEAGNFQIEKSKVVLISEQRRTFQSVIAFERA